MNGTPFDASVGARVRTGWAAGVPFSPRGTELRDGLLSCLLSIQQLEDDIVGQSDTVHVTVDGSTSEAYVVGVHRDVPREVVAVRARIEDLVVNISTHAKRLSVSPEGLGVAPWVIAAGVLAVVGVAAVVAGAWYARETEHMSIDASKAQELAKISSLTDVAHAELKSTGKVSPDTLAALAQAGAQTTESWKSIIIPVAIIGGIAAVASTAVRGRR